MMQHQTYHANTNPDKATTTSLSYDVTSLRGKHSEHNNDVSTNSRGHTLLYIYELCAKSHHVVLADTPPSDAQPHVFNVSDIHNESIHAIRTQISQSLHCKMDFLGNRINNQQKQISRQIRKISRYRL
jgi:hypothetical protein